MRVRLYTLALVTLIICTLLAACGSGGADLSADEVATIVAATLAAEAGPADSAEEGAPAAGLEEPAPIYDDCANADLFTIAYVKDDNVWLWMEGGAHMALTASSDVRSLRISDDGCRIAYTRQVPNPSFDPSDVTLAGEMLSELWAIDSDGSNERLVAGIDFFSTLPAPEEIGIGLYKYAWQPGTHTLGFNTQALTYGLAPSNDVHLADIDSGGIDTLLPGGDGGDFYFSPDGAQVAFSTHESISVIDVDGSNLRSDLIVFPMVITYSEYLYYPPVHWGPDSDDLMVAIPPAEGLNPPVDGVYPETDLLYIPLDGTPPWLAGSVQNVWFAQSEVNFAPDLGRIAYLRPLGELAENRYELVIALSDGSNESAAIELPRISFGDWSPDSNQFIYWFEGDGGVQVRLSDAFGVATPLPLLTDFEGWAAAIQWTQGPYYLQTLRSDADQLELSWINVDGIGIVIDTFSGSFNPDFALP